MESELAEAAPVEDFIADSNDDEVTSGGEGETRDANLESNGLTPNPEPIAVPEETEATVATEIPEILESSRPSDAEASSGVKISPPVGTEPPGPTAPRELQQPDAPPASESQEPTPTPAIPREDDAPPTPSAQAEDLPPQPLAPPVLPRVVAITNQKGGVGKTTTSVNLGATLAELGYRVLVVDLDPQGNASTGMGVNPRNVEHSVYDVILHDLAIEDAVESTAVRNLFCVPATIDLAGAEIELVPAMMRELRLKQAIDATKEDYDWVIIDCPPSLGLLTVNGLAAADDVIVPIQCEYYALEGLGQLLQNVKLIQTRINPKLKVVGIVLTMFDARTRLADQVEQDVREHFGDTVYRTVIPRTVRLSEAPSFGQPIIAFDPQSRGATAYRDLAKEVSRGATIRSR